jgi:hypothetical protein
MLAHIHLSLQWFACEDRPIFNVLVHPGSVSRTSQGPPRAQSPFARSRCYLYRRNVSSITSEGITPPSSLIWTHATDQNPPADFSFLYTADPCRLLPVPAGRWSFPTLSLQSLHRCLDPYPGMPLWCIRPFLPRELQPHFRCTKFGTSNLTVAMQLQRRPHSRGGSHSVMFRRPCLLAPQVAPTAQARSPTGSRVVYATQWTGSYLPEPWYRYMTESDNYHGGTLTHWIAALSAAPCNIGDNFPRCHRPPCSQVQAGTGAFCLARDNMMDNI